jgi:hypothetical protein
VLGEQFKGPALVEEDAAGLSMFADACSNVSAGLSEMANTINRRTAGLIQREWKQCIAPTVLPLPGQERRYPEANLTPLGAPDLPHAELAPKWNPSPGMFSQRRDI